MRFVAARCQQTILPEVHQSPGLIWAVTAPQVRTLLALEVRLDVGLLEGAVDAVQKQGESREKAKHPVPHANPGVEQPEQPLVRTLLALEVRLDVGFLDEAVDAVQKQAESREKAKHPVPHANPWVEQPEQPLVTELSVVVLQQEVVPPLFEGHACCETDAGCVFYDGGAGGEKTPQIWP
eukprot:s2051_g18.t1